MNCLKCGRETDQTFCETCRAEMEKHPVKPGTIVLLPRERPSAVKPSNWRPPVTPEELVEKQKRTIRRMSRGLAVLAALLLLMGFGIVRLLKAQSRPAVGQNYSAVTRPPTEASESTEAGAQAAPQALGTQAQEAAIAPAELEDYLFAQEESRELAQTGSAPTE